MGRIASIFLLQRLKGSMSGDARVWSLQPVAFLVGLRTYQHPCIMFISLISRHSFILPCRTFLHTIVVSLLYLFFQSSYLTVLFHIMYPFHVPFLYTLSPSFPSSSFSSSTFRSFISIHCNLSFRVQLQLHTTLSFQPLSFHCSSLNTILPSRFSFFPHPLSLVHLHFFVSLTMNLYTILFLLFFTCLLHIIFQLSYSFPSSLFHVSPPLRILWPLTTSLQLATSPTPLPQYVLPRLTGLLPESHCKVQPLSPTESHHFTVLNNTPPSHQIRCSSHSTQFVPGQ